MMRSVGILLASAIALAAPAHAAETVLLSDNFNNENGGVYALNYTGFANWDVTPGSQVDLVFDGDIFNLKCNTGGCVDLDGTVGPGEIVSKASFAYAANSLLRVSFDLSGSQRDTIEDDFYVGFLPTDATDITGYGYTVGGVDNVFFGSFSPAVFSGTIGGLAPWALQSVFVITSAAGSAKVAIGTSSFDQKGPLLDNVVVSIGAVPEPATWAMMIAGFGIAGASLRRRKTSVAFA